MRESEEAGRPLDRNALLAAMKDYGLMNGEFASMNETEQRHFLSIAVQRFLAESNSAIQLIPLEDALELEEQVNIPGTVEEHANWKRKLPLMIDEFWQDSSVDELIRVMQQTRP